LLRKAVFKERELALAAHPPTGCCNQEFVVYVVRSDIPGQYDVEFRLGRGDASVVYYEVSILHVTVSSSRANSSWWVGVIAGIVVLLAVVAVLKVRRGIEQSRQRDAAHGMNPNRRTRLGYLDY
jgi:hypothetical protein